MPREPISPDDAAVLSRLTQQVLRTPAAFERGAELLRTRFNLATLRRQSARELCGMRRATYSPQQEAMMTTWLAENPSVRWRDRDGRLLFHQPGPHRRFEREHTRWRGVRDPVASAFERLHFALEWAHAVPVAMMSLADAEAVCLLAWVLYDDRAHERVPVLTEFQLLPWDWYSEAEDRFRPAREIAADSRMDGDTAALASIALAKVEANAVAAVEPTAAKLARGEAPSPVAAPVLDAAHLSAEDIARHAGVPFDALRKRLERWRRSNDGDWIEAANKRRGEPTYLYRWGAVQHIVRELRDALGSSTDASTERPRSQGDES